MVFPREADPANRKALQERVNLLEIYSYMIDDLTSSLGWSAASKDRAYALGFQKFLAREPGADTSGLAQP
jgi:hypothetical protein